MVYLLTLCYTSSYIKCRHDKELMCAPIDIFTPVMALTKF